jgi:hypothetical protein
MVTQSTPRLGGQRRLSCDSCRTSASSTVAGGTGIGIGGGAGGAPAFLAGDGRTGGGTGMAIVFVRAGTSDGARSTTGVGSTMSVRRAGTRPETEDEAVLLHVTPANNAAAMPLHKKLLTLERCRIVTS